VVGGGDGGVVEVTVNVTGTISGLFDAPEAERVTEPL